MNPFNWKWRLAWGLGAVWTVLSAASLLWNLHQARQTALELASTQALLSYNKDLVYRLWAAGHGGVYVPITPETPPNPYLSHIPERDIRTPSGRALTLMNPAYMTRQVHELAAQVYGIKGHLTSLKSIRPENAPDAWEAKALKAFEAGTPEVLMVGDSAGEPHLRFMRPMRTEKACLKCHAAQGYKEGDIRGGISVDVSLKPFLVGIRSQTFTLAFGHGLIWVLGLTGIIMGNRRIFHYLGERKQAEEALKQAYDELEHRVVERTMDLRETVGQLQWEITERQRVEDALRESEERLRFLASQLLTAQETERGRLSRELHDDLGQALLVLRMRLNAILRRCSLEPEPRQNLEEAATYLLGVIDKVRRLSQDLSPSTLESLGLSEALRYLLEEFQKYSDQEMIIKADLDEVKDILPEEANIVIYRITQEFLANVHKHSEATQVAVAIKVLPEKVTISLEDNGKGFDLEKIKDRPKERWGLGVASMIERLRMLGSQFSMTSQRGQGTRLYFEIPRIPEQKFSAILAC